MRNLWIVVPLSLGLMSCAGDDKAQSQLSVACAVKKCICEAKEKPFFSSPERRDVLWQGNGNAYCPQGFALAVYVDKSKPMPGGIALPRETEPYPCYGSNQRCKNQENMAE